MMLLLMMVHQTRCMLVLRCLLLLRPLSTHCREDVGPKSGLLFDNLFSREKKEESARDDDDVPHFTFVVRHSEQFVSWVNTVKVCSVSRLVLDEEGAHG